MLLYIYLSESPVIISHKVYIEPEYLKQHEYHKIMCNVEVNPADTYGIFSWLINGFELRKERTVQSCSSQCVSQPCDCVTIQGVEWYYSGK